MFRHLTRSLWSTTKPTSNILTQNPNQLNPIEAKNVSPYEIPANGNNCVWNDSASMCEKPSKSSRRQLSRSRRGHALRFSLSNTLFRFDNASKMRLRPTADKHDASLKSSSRSISSIDLTFREKISTRLNRRWAANPERAIAVDPKKSPGSLRRRFF